VQALGVTPVGDGGISDADLIHLCSGCRCWSGGCRGGSLWSRHRALVGFGEDFRIHFTLGSAHGPLADEFVVIQLVDDDSRCAAEVAGYEDAVRPDANPENLAIAHRPEDAERVSDPDDLDTPFVP